MGSSVGLANGSLRQLITLPETIRRGRAHAVALAYDSLFAGARPLPATKYGAGSSPRPGAVHLPTMSFQVAMTCVRLGSRGDEGGLQPGSCGRAGEACTPGSVQSIIRPLRVSVNGDPRQGIDPNPANPATDHVVHDYATIETLPSGKLPAPGFRLERVEVTSPPATPTPRACVADEGVPGSSCPQGFGARDPICPDIEVPVEEGPLLTMVRSVFVNHRMASHYGNGWGIEGIERVYRNALADEAVIVDGTGGEEYFVPRVDVADEPNPAAVGEPVYAWDQDHGALFSVDDAGNIFLVSASSPSSSPTKVVGPLAFGGAKVSAFAVGRVGGERRFVIALENRVIDVDESGQIRDLNPRPVGGSSALLKQGGLAARGKFAYYAQGGIGAPILYRFDLSVDPPGRPESLTTGSGNRSLDPRAEANRVQFAEPHGLTFGLDGRLYVADRGRNVVYAMEPDTNGDITSLSKVVRAFGDGAGRFFPPLGLGLPAAEFPINQPMLLSTAPDGTIWAFTADGAVTYDVDRKMAKWAFFDSSFPNSDLAKVPLGWAARASVLALDARRLHVQDAGRGFRFQVTPLSSRYEPTRTLTFDAQRQARVVDTGADIEERYDAQGRLTERRTRPGDPILRVSYVGGDWSSRIDRITDPSGGDTVFSYDGNQKLRSITDPANRVTTFEIDADNDLRSIREPSAPGEPEQHTFVYDRHRMTEKHDPRGDVTRYEYSPNGILAATHKADGQSYTEIAPAYEQPPVRAPDGGTRFAGSFRDPRGILHSYKVDGLGMVEIEEYAADGVAYALRNVKAAALGAITNQERRNLIGRVAYTSVNGLRVSPILLYDTMGRVAKVAATDAGHVARALGYDADGRLVRVDLPSTFIQYSYQAGRLASIQERTSPGTAAEFEERWEWRPDGLLDKHVAHGVDTTFGYDPNGNLTSASDTLGRTLTLTRGTPPGLVTAETDGVATWTYGYDPQNRLRTAMDGLGKTTRYDYTPGCGCLAEDRITSVQTPDLPASKRWSMAYGPSAGSSPSPTRRGSPRRSTITRPRVTSSRSMIATGAPRRSPTTASAVSRASRTRPAGSPPHVIRSRRRAASKARCCCPRAVAPGRLSSIAPRRSTPVRTRSARARSTRGTAGRLGSPT